MSETRGLRCWWTRLADLSYPTASQYIVIDKRIPVENPSGEIALRYVRPSSDGETYPVLVWYHGGGYYAEKLKHEGGRLNVVTAQDTRSVILIWTTTISGL